MRASLLSARWVFAHGVCCAVLCLLVPLRMQGQVAPCSTASPALPQAAPRCTTATGPMQRHWQQCSKHRWAAALSLLWQNPCGRPHASQQPAVCSSRRACNASPGAPLQATAQCSPCFHKRLLAPPATQGDSRAGRPQFVPGKGLLGGAEGVKALAGCLDIGAVLLLHRMDLESLQNPRVRPMPLATALKAQQKKKQASAAD